MYPDTGDLVTALTAAGLPVPSQNELVYALGSSISLWDRETGYSPFAAEDMQFTLDAPTDGVLKLTVPCLAIYEIRVAGQLWLAGQDYIPITDGLRTWALRFRKSLPPTPQSVMLYGYFGYVGDPDMNVRQCVLRRAMLACVDLLMKPGQADGIEKWVQGDESVSYSQEKLSELLAWSKCPKGREDSFGGATYGYRNMGVFF